MRSFAPLLVVLGACSGRSVPNNLADWIPIEGGCFTQGKAGVERTEPLREVCVDDFEMMKAEVTVGHYMKCVEEGACAEPTWENSSCSNFINGEVVPISSVSEHLRADNLPITCITAAEASAFGQWAGGRLPSESEFEWVASQWGTTNYPWGEQPADCERSNLDDGSGPGCGEDGPSVACSRPSGNSPQGICDLAGNVVEWVADTRHDTYEGAPEDGSAWVEEGATHQVHRGGDWMLPAEQATSRYRSWAQIDARSVRIGFRLVR